MANTAPRPDRDRVEPPDGGPPTPSGGDAQSDSSPGDDERLLRAMADLDNFRKRFEREVVRARKAERCQVAAAWLPVVDDLDRAVEHTGTDGGTSAGLVEGLRAVRDHAIAVLAALGFPRFEDVGERFDPARHEAVGAVEADAPPGTVVAVVRPGYGAREDILRPAAVVVARE